MTDDDGHQPRRTVAPALEMRGITKRYPGVVANDHIDLDVRPGEIHALLGENGAGKTTLMNVLYGLATPDEGEILLDGEPVRIAGPSDAIARGISMVHQHFMLVPVLTRRREHPPRRGDDGRTGLPRPQARPAGGSSSSAGGSASRSTPTPRSASLSVGWQQRVEILKALYRERADPRPRRADGGPHAPGDRGDLRASCGGSRDEGHSIIFISHKLYEVLEIADRITVIRRGRVVGERLPAETERGGPRRADGRPRGPADGRSRRVPSRRGRCSRSTDLRVKDDRGNEVVRGVDLEVRAGEILGIAGVAGNGQDELVEAIDRAAPADARARSRLDGTDVTGAVAARDERGWASRTCPADRHRFGLVLPFPIADNLVLTSYYRAAVRAGHPAQRRGDRARTRSEAIDEFDIRTPSADGRRPARCRAATSRRSSSPASSTAT